MFPLVGIMFALLKNIVLPSKLRVSISRKYISTSGKKQLFTENYMFQLIGNMFPLLEKQFLQTKKMCVSTSRNYVCTVKKIVAL